MHTKKQLGNKVNISANYSIKEKKRILALNTLKNYQRIYNRRRLSIRWKYDILRSFMESVFLYHLEIWSTNKTINGSIAAFHRRPLCYAKGIEYPKIMSDKKII